jgi:hypothetical protein
MCSGRQPWRGHRQDAAFRQKIDDTKEEINAIMPKMLDLQKKNEERPSHKTGASTTGKGQTESAEHQQSGSARKRRAWALKSGNDTEYDFEMGDDA